MWTLIYIDYLIYTVQLDRLCHVSTTCLAQLDHPGHVSSTINITSSLRSLSKQHCGPPLEGSHNATRLAQTSDMSCIPLTLRALYGRTVQRNMISSTRLVQMSHMDL